MPNFRFIVFEFISNNFFIFNRIGNKLFELCLEAGLKTSELANLRLEDILENKLKINGKSNRIIGISESISEKINNYLNINNLEDRKLLFSKKMVKTKQNFLIVERKLKIIRKYKLKIYVYKKFIFLSK